MTAPPPAEPERSDQLGRHAGHPEHDPGYIARIVAWRQAAELTRAALRDPERARPRP